MDLVIDRPVSAAFLSGGCVGGYSPRNPCNHPRCSCNCGYSKKFNFTLSVNL